MTIQISTSALQVKMSVFKRIYLEAAEQYEKIEGYSAQSFSFQDVPLFSEAKIGIRQDFDEEVGPLEFVVNVTLATVEPNEEHQHDQCPYDFDIEAQIWIEVASNIPVSERIGLVETNGTSLAIGVIREQIINLSSRSIFGPLIIPTLRVAVKEVGES